VRSSKQQQQQQRNQVHLADPTGPCPLGVQGSSGTPCYATTTTTTTTTTASSSSNNAVMVTTAATTSSVTYLQAAQPSCLPNN
jgi:hypothetical protein